MGSDRRKVLIFTGAGIGVPLNLPTTTGFIDSVNNKARPITSQLINYLGVAGNDIEAILSSLDSFANKTAFAEFLLPKLVGSSHINLQKNLDQFKADATREITRIKKIIFTKLAKFDRKKASEIYVNLIAEIREMYLGCPMAIFTTNYDLTFESSIEDKESILKNKLDIEEVEFGFSIRLGRAIYDSTRDSKWNPHVIDFFKLHGSLDWHRDADGRCTRAGSSITPDDPEEMPILYPGYKGIPEVEPFATLHGRLHQRLLEADAVFMIGFAMRDAYINSIFDNVLRSRTSLPIFCFNPVSIDALPKDSRLPHFVQNYRNFQHVIRGIKATAKPLDLKSSTSA